MTTFYLTLLLWQVRFKDFRDNIYVRTAATCIGFLAVFALIYFCALEFMLLFPQP
jgi:hypothetical protein